MQLPDQFTFNQANIQDYVDCEYRFYLRHIQKLEWPAIESEPLLEQEQRILLGYKFHNLVQQYFVSIDPEQLTSSITDPDLEQWWQQFLSLNLNNSPTTYSEKLLTANFEGHRIVAKYDLLIFSEEGQVTIYDWKTSHFQPTRKRLLDRIQTKIYPLLLTLPNSVNPMEPQNIKMCYWFPAFPDSPVQFNYTLVQYKNDLVFLRSLIEQILSKSESRFSKTQEERTCSFCRYRSLCERGVKAAILTQTDTDKAPGLENPFEIDFDLL